MVIGLSSCGLKFSKLFVTLQNGTGNVVGTVDDVLR